MIATVSRFQSTAIHSSAEAATPRQIWDPERYGRDARFVSQYGVAVVEALAREGGDAAALESVAAAS